MKPIYIKNLNHSFGKGILNKKVLFNINLQIRRREIVILTGQSGSGKTTLLSLIGGLRSVQNGSLQVLGQELFRADEDKIVSVRRQIGFIFQHNNLIRFMTAQQNVQIANELQPNISRQQTRKNSQAMLKAVGLGNKINSYPDQLSGGQQQRVAIARALVNRPQLILADEPTAALDSQTGREIIELIQILAKEQDAAILLVTHDNRILDVADHIIHMQDGHLQMTTNY